MIFPRPESKVRPMQKSESQPGYREREKREPESMMSQYAQGHETKVFRW